MIPLVVTVTLRSAITLPPGGGLALDGLLASVVALEQGLVAGFGEMVRPEIPIAESACKRFHLASYAMIGDVPVYERRFVNRRPIAAEAQMFGDSKRLNITAGVNKGYRIPQQTAHVRSVTWFAIGDLEEVRRLLQHVTHLGKKRSVGRGAIETWRIEPCPEMWDGFPVVRDGKPLRALPSDYPGLTSPKLRQVTLTYPYWEARRAEVCAVP